jgi:hypothetical protein
MKKLLSACSVLLLFALLSLLMGASATKSLVIDVSEDSYIVADLNDPNDSYGFMEKNYGDLKFVKAWYLWNVVEEEVIPEGEEGEEAEPELVEMEYEKIISIIYLKFDLSELEGMEVESAMLQLYAQNVAILTPRYVQVFQVESDWDELTLNFNNAPPGGQNALSTTTVYQADQRYGWDVTSGVKTETQSGQISLAVMLRDMDKASEELVAFPSHETGENAARLLITYTKPGFVFSWYWWVIGGVVVLALLVAAFFGGLKLKRTKPAE